MINELIVEVLTRWVPWLDIWHELKKAKNKSADTFLNSVISWWENIISVGEFRQVHPLLFFNSKGKGVISVMKINPTGSHG